MSAHTQLTTEEYLAYSRHSINLCILLTKAKDAMMFEFLADELRRTCDILGKSMPDLSLLGSVVKKPDLLLGIQGGTK